MQREHVSGLAPSALVQIEGETSRQKEEKWSGTEMDKRETLTASWEELEADWAKGFQIRAQRPLMMQRCCGEVQNVKFSETRSYAALRAKKRLPRVSLVTTDLGAGISKNVTNAGSQLTF